MGFGAFAKPFVRIPCLTCPIVCPPVQDQLLKFLQKTFPASFTFSPFCLGLRLIPPFCGFASPFFSSCFVFGCLVDPFWTGWGGGIGEGEVELVVEEEEKVVEVQHGVFGFGLWRGEATWLVKWVRSLSCTGFDVAHEARRGEPSCVHKIHI